MHRPPTYATYCLHIPPRPCSVSGRMLCIFDFMVNQIRAAPLTDTDAGTDTGTQRAELSSVTISIAKMCCIVLLGRTVCLTVCLSGSLPLCGALQLFVDLAVRFIAYLMPCNKLPVCHRATPPLSAFLQCAERQFNNILVPLLHHHDELFSFCRGLFISGIRSAV